RLRREHPAVAHDDRGNRRSAPDRARLSLRSRSGRHQNRARAAVTWLGAQLPEPLRVLLRTASWHRRLLASGLAAAAVAFGLSVVAPKPPPVVRVLAAARDVP